MNIIEKYGISFPIGKEELLNIIKNKQTDLVFQKGSMQDDSIAEELLIIEKLNEMVECTPDSRIDKVVMLYDCLVKGNSLTDAIHHLLLDYMKGDFDALKKIDELCEKQNVEALLTKAFYLYDGTFDIVNKKESKNCLKQLYSLGYEEVYEIVYAKKYGGKYMLIKMQTICSITMMCIALILTIIMIMLVNKM